MLASHLDQWNKCLRTLFLQPKAIHIDVSHLSQPSSIKYSLGGCGIQLENNAQCSPRSSHNVLVPSASQTPRTTPYDSLSAELFAITAWVFDRVFIQCVPRDMETPEVLFRDLRHPAQSASVLTVISFPSPCMAYFQTSLGCILRYLPMRRKRRRDPVLGLLISLQPSLNAKTQSGLCAAM